MGKMGSQQSASPALLCRKFATTLYVARPHDKLETLYI
jgi:hypothetical protein